MYRCCRFRFSDQSQLVHERCHGPPRHPHRHSDLARRSPGEPGGLVRQLLGKLETWQQLVRETVEPLREQINGGAVPTRCAHSTFTAPQGALHVGPVEWIDAGPMRRRAAHTRAGAHNSDYARSV